MACAAQTATALRLFRSDVHRTYGGQPVQSFPDSDDWMYEMKLDGDRALLIKNGLQV